MTFATLSLCTSKPHIEQQPKVELLSCSHKATLVTDVFLAALAVAVAVLIILANHGVSLGEISAIGSLGTTAAFSMIGAASALILMDIVILLVQMARRKGLGNLKDQLTEARANVQTLTEEKKQLEETNTFNSNEVQRLQLANQQLKEQANNQLVDLKQKAESESQRTQILLKERESEITQLKETLTSGTQGADALAKNRITQLETEVEQLKTQTKLEKNIDELQTQLKQAQGKLDQLVENIQSYQGEQLQLEQNIFQMQQELGQLKTAKSELEEIVQKHTLQKAELEKAQQAVNALTEKAEKIKLENQQAEQTAKVIEQKAQEEAKKNQEQAKEILETAHMQANEITKKAKSEAEAKQKATEFKLNEAEQQLATLANHKNELETKIKELTEALQAVSINNTPKPLEPPDRSKPLNPVKGSEKPKGQSNNDRVKELLNDAWTFISQQSMVHDMASVPEWKAHDALVEQLKNISASSLTAYVTTFQSTFPSQLVSSSNKKWDNKAVGLLDMLTQKLLDFISTEWKQEGENLQKGQPEALDTYIKELIKHIEGTTIETEKNSRINSSIFSFAQCLLKALVEAVSKTNSVNPYDNSSGTNKNVNPEKNPVKKGITTSEAKFTPQQLQELQKQNAQNLQDALSYMPDKSQKEPFMLDQLSFDCLNGKTSKKKLSTKKQEFLQLTGKYDENVSEKGFTYFTTNLSVIKVAEEIRKETDETKKPLQISNLKKTCDEMKRHLETYREARKADMSQFFPSQKK